MDVSPYAALELFPRYRPPARRCQHLEQGRGARLEAPLVTVAREPSEGWFDEPLAELEGLARQARLRGRIPGRRPGLG